MPAVFISHASGDPAWPDDEVERLASRLKRRGVDVQFDRWHERAAHRNISKMAWRQWMKACLKADPIVLCLGSTTFVQRAQRLRADPTGKGVAFETVEVLKRLYDGKGDDDGWLWMAIRTGTDPQHVVLDDYEWQVSLYIWDEQQDRLVDDLAHHASGGGKGPATASVSAPAASALPAAAPRSTLVRQRDLAAERLSATPALWRALCADDWDDQPPDEASLASPAALCTWLEGRDAAAAQDAMIVVRRALLATRTAVPGDAAALLAAERAAIALYCLAACRLVAPLSTSPASVVPVADPKPLYCAVIAAVLAGGRLELRPGGTGALPAPEFAFEFTVPPDGTVGPGAFERALFAAVCSGHPSAPRVARGAGPLDDDDRGVLLDRLDSIRRVQRSAITLVVHGLHSRDPAAAFAAQQKVPVFVPDGSVPSALMAITPGRLLGLFSGFWSELQHPDHCAASTAASAPTTAHPTP